MKVHEKMTCSSTMGAKQSGFKRQIQMEEEAEDREVAAEAERLKALRESISWKIAVTKGKELFANTQIKTHREGTKFRSYTQPCVD